MASQIIDRYVDIIWGSGLEIHDLLTVVEFPKLAKSMGMRVDMVLGADYTGLNW
jgi:hypothetical protein